MSTINFYWKSTCSTCRRARSFLINNGIPFHERNFAQKPFTKAEVSQLLQDHDVASFINPKSTPYKTLALNQKKLTREEMIELLAKENNLFKRPFIIKEGEVILGFSLPEYEKLLA